MAHQAIAIIPARLGSTRFPAKALAHETGKPLVVHACEQAGKASCVSRVVVATDATEIKSAVESHGYEAVMTSPEHTNGTSRLAETARLLDLGDLVTIVNVQGDEPEIEPEVIDGAVAALCEGEGGIHAHTRFKPAVGTVASPIENLAAADDPNIVKVAMGIIEPDHGIAQALYFSRASIPFNRDQSPNVRYFRHVGIYAYSVKSLNAYMALEASPLEQSESLEQLRWLEHGHQIAVAVRSSSHSGIDTPEQYRAFVERYRQKNHPI